MKGIFHNETLTFIGANKILVPRVEEEAKGVLAFPMAASQPTHFCCRILYMSKDNMTLLLSCDAF